VHQNKDRATAAIPVIVLSSLSQVNEDKLRTAGATGYFKKIEAIR
jgi:hypothetical protein